MIRFFFERMLGPAQWWWGAIIVLLAGSTALITVFYALISKDLKTALAYHSVENIGIILVGVGMALMFSDTQMFSDPQQAAGRGVRAAATLALLASLFHVVNHALFKTLLFLGTGSIERPAGADGTTVTGGLLRRSPWVGVTFLIGATAIAGLPPLNGFVSEWLTLQALFGGQAARTTRSPVVLLTMITLALGLIMLATAFAVTALAFVKIAGESLLGPSRRAPQTGEPAWSMRSVLAVLAGCCLVLGLQPWLLVPWLYAAIAHLPHDASVLQATPGALTIELPLAEGTYGATLPVLPLLLLVGMAVLLTTALTAGGWVRRPAWVGGEPFEPVRMRYPGSAMSSLLWTSVAREHGERISTPLPALLPVSARHSVLELSSRLYNGAVTAILARSQRLGTRLQSGDIRAYLLYIFAAVLLVLLVVAISG